LNGKLKITFGQKMEGSERGMDKLAAGFVFLST
jgi:hypothetical protein